MTQILGDGGEALKSHGNDVEARVGRDVPEQFADILDGHFGSTERHPEMQLEGQARHWAQKSLEMNLDEGDEADEDTLNRILWFSVHGNKPYPEEFVGGKDNGVWRFTRLEMHPAP